MDRVAPEDLLLFLHNKKTEISCLDKPLIFLQTLRDKDLIEEERYQKMKNMKSKETIIRNLYDALDWVEKERSNRILDFWSCVCSENVMNYYPALRSLRQSLTDGSYKACIGTPVKTEKVKVKSKETGQPSKDSGGEEKPSGKGGKGKKMPTKVVHSTAEQAGPSASPTSGVKEVTCEPAKGPLSSVAGAKSKKRGQASKGREGEEKQSVKGGKRKKMQTNVAHSTEEQAGPSASLTSGVKEVTCEPAKGPLSSMRKGINMDSANFHLCKTRILVTCGNAKGYLHKTKLAKGEKCISVKGQWFTPNGFQRIAGKDSYKNWKKSISHKGTPLEKLIQDGYLRLKTVKRQAKPCQPKKLTPPKAALITEPPVDNVEKEGGGALLSVECVPSATPVHPGQAPVARRKAVYNVTCGTETGILHVKRFLSGTHGRSVRTEERWMTPAEFVTSGSFHPNAHWEECILHQGKPISALIEAKVLKVHPLQCHCNSCKDSEDRLGQKNDDECFACGKKRQLVLCSSCPRSFHQMCHLPRLPDTSLTYNRLLLNPEELSRSLDLSRPISSPSSPSIMQCHYLLLTLYNADKRRTFAEDPSLSREGYTEVIKNPMWLGKVAEKLEMRMYQTVEDMVNDIRLIFSNSAAYSKEHRNVQTGCVRLRKLFEKELKIAFSSQDEIAE